MSWIKVLCHFSWWFGARLVLGFLLVPMMLLLGVVLSLKAFVSGTLSCGDAAKALLGYVFAPVKFFGLFLSLPRLRKGVLRSAELSTWRQIFTDKVVRSDCDMAKLAVLYIKLGSKEDGT